jgi:uncharacterized protein with GYD domain
METIKDLPEGIKESRKVFESFGVKVMALYFTLGRYDVVAIGEAPNEEAITKALLSWGSGKRDIVILSHFFFKKKITQMLILEA